MRLPLGSTDVSESGGTVTLVSRTGAEWIPVAAHPMELDEAVRLLDDGEQRRAHADPVFDEAVLSDSPDAPRFAPGQAILWRYGRYIETARVIRDDDCGLVVWIPSGSERLGPVPADGRAPREVPLDERFSVPWVMRESTWRGPGVVRIAPAGRPWSVWFFRRADGTPAGAYVNLELPHRRADGAAPAIFSRDLVLDLWIDAEHSGSEDVWLKDADELVAAVDQGRFTPQQAEAVRAIADHAVQEFIARGTWPLDEGWDAWRPDVTMDDTVRLPDIPAIDDARRRSGSTSLEG